jgi:hypothetical protein
MTDTTTTKRPHQGPTKYTDEVLRAIAAQYPDRTSFRVSQPSAYQTAVVRGLLASITSHMPKRRRVALVEIDPAMLTRSSEGSS